MKTPIVSQGRSRIWEGRAWNKVIFYIPCFCFVSKFPKYPLLFFKAAVRTGNIPELLLLLIEGIKVPELWRPGEFQGSRRAGAALCNFAQRCGEKGKKSKSILCWFSGLCAIFQEMFEVSLEEHQCWGCQGGPVGGGSSLARLAKAN